MTSVADAVQAMKAKFNPDAAAGLDLVFGFRIDDTKNFSLVVKDKTCELKEGENPDAQVTLVMDGETLEGIVGSVRSALRSGRGITRGVKLVRYTRVGSRGGFSRCPHILGGCRPRVWASP